MDVLSDVIAIVRTGRPRSARVEWHAPWGQRFPTVRRLGRLPGDPAGLVLADPAGRRRPIALSVGDVVFFPTATATRWPTAPPPR